jgi:hypothetical protein
MMKKLALAAAGLTLLTFAGDAEAASKPRLMIKPQINVNSVHLPPMRIVRLKLRSRVQVSTPSFTP